LVGAHGYTDHIVTIDNGDGRQHAYRPNGVTLHENNTRLSRPRSIRSLLSEHWNQSTGN